MQIKTETFTATAEIETVTSGKYSWTREPGTVEVAFGGKSLTVEAFRYEDGEIGLIGFVGRYRTSPKPWLASVRADKNGSIFASFGRDDRSGRFQKLQGISYEPQTYAAIRAAR